MNKKGKMGRKIVFLGLAPKCWSRVIFSTGVNQNLGVPQCLRAAPKCWYVFSFLAFCVFPVAKKYGFNQQKACKAPIWLVKIHNICRLIPF